MKKQTLDASETVIDQLTKSEVDAELDKIFESASKAIKESQKNITLEKVDQTLNALFDAVNGIALEGKNAKIPNFREIL